MEDPIIVKIKQIVLDHLDDEKFGVKELSSKIGLSKSQAFRKVKSLTNKSINQLINETRLEEAAKLILESDLHASEISYKVGFSSPSYFNKCFSKYYGITPGGYKEKYKDHLPILGFDQKTSPSGIKKFQAIFYILGVAILLFVIFSVIKSKNSTANRNPTDISIAILYFEDYSPESDIQWFCNGITEEIITKLTGIKKLKVTSRTSVKQFRNSNRSIPEIAQILGVDYIIEGSVRKDNDSIRITTQLINPKDKHEWSINYDESLENTLKIQSEFSKLIAEKLKIDLSPEEMKIMEKFPTDNIEAYNLYLKGRYFWNQSRRTEEIVKNSVKYFEQCIEKDPEYALAYAGLADAYLSLTGQGFIPRGEGIAKVKKMALKSIELDSTNAEAHTTLGWLAQWIEWNWKDAEKELNIAIKLNPNYAIAHEYYAEYLQHVKSSYDESREQLNLALFLDPLSYEAIIRSAQHYSHGNRYDKALIESRKAQEINKYNTGSYWVYFNIYIKQRKYRMAVDELQKIMRLDTLTFKNTKVVGDVYEKSGIEGVFQWLIDQELTQQNYNSPYFLAEKYAFIGEKEKALAMLEIAFERQIPFTPTMKDNFYFESIYPEPRFIALLKKMDLEDYN